MKNQPKNQIHFVFFAENPVWQVEDDEKSIQAFQDRADKGEKTHPPPVSGLDIIGQDDLPFLRGKHFQQFFGKHNAAKIDPSKAQAYGYRGFYQMQCDRQGRGRFF